MNTITDGLAALNDGTEAAKRLLEIAKEVKGCFAYFKSMPSVALVKMNKVFKEVDDTVRAVGDVIDRYLELGLDLTRIDEDPKVLIDLSGTGLKKLVEDKRGHCSTIWGIRQEYLDGWFNKYRNDYPVESQKIDMIFDELSNADTDLFYRLAEVATYIQLTGEKALKEAYSGDIQSTKDTVKNAAIALLDLRSTLENIHTELSSIKAKYIEEMKLSEAGN